MTHVAHAIPRRVRVSIQLRWPRFFPPHPTGASALPLPTRRFAARETPGDLLDSRSHRFRALPRVKFEIGCKLTRTIRSGHEDGLAPRAFQVKFEPPAGAPARGGDSVIHGQRPDVVPSDVLMP